MDYLRNNNLIEMEDLDSKSASVAMNQRQVKSISTSPTKFNEEDLNLTVETFKDQNVGNDQNPSFYGNIVMKNPSTYMELFELVLPGHGLRLKVIKNGKEIYSELPPDLCSVICPSVYVDTLDCFFFIQKNNLYRKDIDDQPPRIYLGLGPDTTSPSKLWYSSVNQRLIGCVNSGNWVKLIVINLKKKKIEVQFHEKLGQSFSSFELFGKNQNQFVFLTRSGRVVLRVFNFFLKKAIKSKSIRIALLNHLNRVEYARGLAVSDDEKYIFVQLVGEFSFFSRLAVLSNDRNRNGFVLKTILNPNFVQSPEFKILRCFGCFQNHVLCIGMEKRRDSSIRVYDYSIKEDSLRELEEKSVSHQVVRLQWIKRFGNSFFYASEDGNYMMRLNINH